MENGLRVCLGNMKKGGTDCNKTQCYLKNIGSWTRVTKLGKKCKHVCLGLGQEYRVGNLERCFTMGVL